MRVKSVMVIGCLILAGSGLLWAAESVTNNEATQKPEAAVAAPESPAKNDSAPSETPAAPQKLTLDECLKIALERNHRQPASKFAVEAADAQLRQVKAGYMPQFLARSTYLRQDEPGNFIFPEESSFYQVKGLDALLPPGVPAGTPIPLNVTIPEKDVKLGDRTSWVNEVGMKFPLYTGGQLEGLTKQARAG
ncbi:MAG TPA: TolC family protein, partial [Candidatus Ozemobacteraceae bacterium]|nr:TolC family protein [Candidatus Ozemobacteraceae bacterium]